MGKYINSYFDKIFVITCKHLKDRHKYIKQHFKEHNITDYWFTKAKYKKKFSNTHISNSAKSLIYAHMQCIEKAKKNNFKKILICEDDVNFVSNVNIKFNTFINNIPTNWNFLQLGNQFWCIKEHPEWLHVKHYNEFSNLFLWGTGSHCIAIKNSMFDICIDKFKSMKTPVDFLYYDLFKDYVCYSPKCFLADALSFQNDIGGKSNKHIFKSQISHGFTNID